MCQSQLCTHSCRNMSASWTAASCRSRLRFRMPCAAPTTWPRSCACMCTTPIPTRRLLPPLQVLPPLPVLNLRKPPLSQTLVPYLWAHLPFYRGCCWLRHPCWYDGRMLIAMLHSCKNGLVLTLQSRGLSLIPPLRYCSVCVISFHYEMLPLYGAHIGQHCFVV